MWNLLNSLNLNLVANGTVEDVKGDSSLEDVFLNIASKDEWWIEEDENKKSILDII